MVYQISSSQQGGWLLGWGGVRWLGWGGVRPATAGWLTVGGGGALAGPRRVVLTAGAGHATPASAPQTPLERADTLLRLGRAGAARRADVAPDADALLPVGGRGGL